MYRNQEFERPTAALSRPNCKVWGFTEASVIRDWLDNYIWYSGLALTTSANTLIVSRNRVVVEVLRHHNLGWIFIANFLSVSLRRAQQYHQEFKCKDLLCSIEGQMIRACIKNRFISY